MNNQDIISVLKKDITINGIPIKETKMFRILSDMNVSDQDISDYSNGVHNMKKKQGVEAAERMLLIIFRINPLAAIKAIETDSVPGDSGALADSGVVLAYSVKPMFSVIREGGYYLDRDANENMMLNNHKVPYVVLLIEAVFQKSISESWNPDMFLQYAQKEDLKLYQNGKKSKYLNSYNIRHILTNIPENRKIELINWFWDQHCYTAFTYKKKESFAGNRVQIMMSQLMDGALWQHLENENKQELSLEEQTRLETERDGMKHFIDAVVSEGRHLQFIKKILGEEDFYGKLASLMGDGYCERYDFAVLNQKKLEDEESLAEQKRLKEEILAKEKAEYERVYAQRLKQKKAEYLKLVAKVKAKYTGKDSNKFLDWHNIEQKIEDNQISLWNYFQGSNFSNVKIMVLAYDWGSVNEKSKEMAKCLKKIKSLKNGSINTQYYSCKHRKMDYNLEWLFKNCFNRDIRTNKYSDLFFTEACLGYRIEPRTVISEEMVNSDITDFLKDEINIVQPKVIFCLGEIVYELVGKYLKSEFAEYGRVHLDIEGVLANCFTLEGKTFVYYIPHCGVDGIKKMAIEDQLVIWNKVRDCMKEDGIEL